MTAEDTRAALASRFGIEVASAPVMSVTVPRFEKLYPCSQISAVPTIEYRGKILRSPLCFASSANFTLNEELNFVMVLAGASLARASLHFSGV